MRTIKPHAHKFKKQEDGEIYRFCLCGKRKKGLSVIKQRKALQLKAESLWKQYAHMRDGEGCQIQKVFPELKLNHSNRYQVDHFFPRADKNLFFETANSTVICSTCNYLKSNGSAQSIQILMAIQTIVTRREGEKKFYEMCEINNQRKPNTEWGREHWLRNVIAKLETAIEWIKADNGPMEDIEEARNA